MKSAMDLYYKWRENLQLTFLQLLNVWKSVFQIITNFNSFKCWLSKDSLTKLT